MTGTDTRRASGASWLVPLLAGLLILTALVWGLFSLGTSRMRVGERAPAFTLSLLDGREVRLEDLRGKVVVLNFWASWCGPCRLEAPAVEQVWRDYQGQIALLGIAHNDTAQQMQAFIQRYGVTYANGLDARGRIARAYGVTAVPETFVIDREGIVRAHQVGAIDDPDTLAAMIEDALNASP